jgi:hypothetical protein
MSTKEMDDSTAKKQIDQMVAFILQEAKEKAQEIKIKVLLFLCVPLRFISFLKFRLNFFFLTQLASLN